MATTYSPNVKIRKPAVGDRVWSTPVNENADLLDAVSAIGGLAVSTVEVPSTSLNVRVGSGNFRSSTGTIVAYAGTASQAVSASATTLLWLTDGAVLTTGAAWPGTVHVRLATVVAGTSTITSVTDERVQCGAAGVVTTSAPVDATYIVQTANATLTAEQALSALTTGLLKVTTGTGVLSTAVANTDYQAADTDLTALAGVSTTGVLIRTGSGTANTRTITGTTNQVVVTNGDGVSGNPTLSTPQNIHTAAAPTFAGMTFSDAGNLALGTTTGTKIGTATSQKIGLWNVTPVIQPAGANQAALTDSTTGTAGFTLVDVTATPTQAAINNNFASVARLLNQLRSDLVAVGVIKGSA